VPYIDLRAVFAMGGVPPEIERVVIVNHEDTRIGLVVDRVVGTHQTVIQSLGKFYRNVEVASGATIMGDGRVALILDPARLIQFADWRCRQMADAPATPVEALYP
jgi:two-component system chemotaxis sensor kinase CheA